MGIYYQKSDTCDCQGVFSTLCSNDRNIYMQKPCIQHEIQKGNTIYYNLQPIISHLLKKTKCHFISSSHFMRYEVNIIDVVETQQKKIIKIEVQDHESLLSDDYDPRKQIFYSDFNDEPMFQKTNHGTICFIFTYLPKYHTVKNVWEGWC